MTRDEIFSKKLAAFLHDPIDKPLILMQGISHEQRAAHIADLLQITYEKTEGPDWIASAMERVLLPKGSSRKEALQVKFLEHPEIKHPLSGKELDCELITSCSLEQIQEIVNSAASTLEATDPETLYLRLWRNYVEIIKAQSPDGLKKFWDVIPADTRIPDHSIFEHLRITSACFNVMRDQEHNTLHHDLAFLLVSIGPVQPFIKTARKLQDLWMGSFMLSYLIWTGMKVVVEQYGPDAVIFPDLRKQPLVDHWLRSEKRIRPVGNEQEQHADLKLPTFPNRFLAIIPANGARDFAREVEREVKDSFVKRGVEGVTAFRTMSQDLQITLNSQIQEQLENFLDVYWVVIPWSKSNGAKRDYQTAIETLANYFGQEHIQRIEKIVRFFQEKGEYPPNIGTIYGLLHSFTEKALGARKNIRNFHQLSQEGRKCSLCGERQALFTLSAQEKIRRRQIGILRENEKLCAVCMAKRMGKHAFPEIFGQDDGGIEFPSTAEVALSDFKVRLLQSEKGRHQFTQYVEKCQTLLGNLAHTASMLSRLREITSYDGPNIGGEFFLESFLTEENLGVTGGAVNDLKKDVNALYQVANISPSSYYAVIVLDGDDMGKWLQGEYAPSIDQVFHSQVWSNLSEAYRDELSNVCRDGKRPMSPVIHTAISTALREYSLELVKRIVEQEHLGKLIYAGGDDVLAVVNLRDLLSVMVKLRAAFSGHLDKQFQVDFTADPSGFVDMGDRLLTTMGPTATASMGVVIAHYKTPLSMVLEEARYMEEKQAKRVPDKNAFGICLMKHSGETDRTVAKWWYDDNNLPKGTLAIVEKLARLIREEYVSNKFLYVLKQEFAKVAGEHGILEVNTDVIETEIRRLLRRSQKKELPDDNSLSIEEQLIQLFHNLEENFDNFLNFLAVANFLAREVKL